MKSLLKYTLLGVLTLGATGCTDNFTEINTNPDFLALLQRGVSVEQAYKVLHMDDFLSKATAQAEKTVTDNIRARGARPQENGAAPKSAVVVKDDVSKLTPADRAEIARRAAMGETITFN